MAVRAYTWEPSFEVARAHRDQPVRADGIDAATPDRADTFVDRAERFADGPQKRAAVVNLNAVAGQLNGDGQEALADALRDLAVSVD